MVSTPMARQELRQLLGQELHHTMLCEVYQNEAMLERTAVAGVPAALASLKSLGRIAIERLFWND